MANTCAHSTHFQYPSQSHSNRSLSLAQHTLCKLCETFVILVIAAEREARVPSCCMRLAEGLPARVRSYSSTSAASTVTLPM
jgi:hypothetical protein